MPLLRLACILSLVSLTARAPVFAQALTANPSTVTINYARLGDPAPSSVRVQISPSVALEGHLTANIDSTGARVTGADVVGSNFLFAFSIAGNEVFVGVDTRILGILAARGATTYTGELTIKSPGFGDLIIPLALSVGSGISITASPNPLSISVAGTGSTATTTLVLQSASALNFTVSVTELSSPSITWLNVTPTSGAITPPAQTSLTVQAFATALAVGDYSAKIDIVVGGNTAVSVQVTFHVGTGTTLTLSQSSLNFVYVIGSSGPAAQSITVSGTNSSSYTITPATSTGGAWLLANGSTGATSLVIQAATSISISAAVAATLAPNTYSGSVAFATPDGRTATLPVTLQVTNTPTGPFTPASLPFSYPVIGGPFPAAQQLSLTGSGSYTLIVSTSGNLGWLTVVPTSGTLPATVSVSVNPTGLLQATYTGSIAVLINGVAVGSAAVSLVVGNAGATVNGVSPTSLTFTVPLGQNTPVTQQLVVGGDGTNFTAVATAVPTWISVNPTSGPTPATLTVTANPANLTGGTYQGLISINTNAIQQTVQATLNVATGTILLSNPASFAFTYQAGGPAPATQNVVVSAANVIGDQPGFTVSSATPWINVGSPNSPNTPGVFAMRIDTTRLTGGLNSGSISVSSPSAVNSPLSIPVTVLATGLQSITFTPSTLAFTATAGGGAITQTVRMDPGAGNPFTATASSAGGWLTVSPASGTGSTVLTVTANPAGFATGSYNGTIVVTANGVTQSLNVSLTVTNAGVSPTLVVNPAALTFDYRQGDPAPASQQVQITSGGVIANLTISSNQPWLTASPATGVTPATLTVSVNPSGLAAGTNTGALTITSPGAANSPQTVNVALNVAAQAALTVSAGSLTFVYRAGGAVPASQSLAVTSSGANIAFTASSSAPWITVSPTSGATPATLTISANPLGLGTGANRGTVTITASGSSQIVNITLNITAPLPTITGVANAASGTSGPVAPGEIVVLIGESMAGPDLLSARPSNGFFGTSLAGVKVLFSGLEAPLIFVRSDLIAAIVPYALAGRTATFAQVDYLDQRSNALNLNVVASAPGIFTADTSGAGPAAAFNEDLTVNGPNNPAAPGTIVVLFFTGEGQTNPPGVDGKLADDPGSLPKPQLPVSLLIDNQQAELLYFGAVPTLVAGITQVNARVPLGATPSPRPGQVSVVVNVGNGSSQRNATIWVR